MDLITQTGRSQDNWGTVFLLKDSKVWPEPEPAPAKEAGAIPDNEARLGHRMTAVPGGHSIPTRHQVLRGRSAAPVESECTVARRC